MNAYGGSRKHKLPMNFQGSFLDQKWEQQRSSKGQLWMIHAHWKASDMVYCSGTGSYKSTQLSAIPIPLTTSQIHCSLESAVAFLNRRDVACSSEQQGRNAGLHSLLECRALVLYGAVLACPLQRFLSKGEGFRALEGLMHTIR
jgi:hypothetical protein